MRQLIENLKEFDQEAEVIVEQMPYGREYNVLTDITDIEVQDDGTVLLIGEQDG